MDRAKLERLFEYAALPDVGKVATFGHQYAYARAPRWFTRQQGPQRFLSEPEPEPGPEPGPEQPPAEALPPPQEGDGRQGSSGGGPPGPAAAAAAAATQLPAVGTAQPVPAAAGISGHPAASSKA